MADESQQGEASRVNPVLNRLNLLREEGFAQTLQRQESIQESGLQQEAEAENDAIQIKGIEEQTAEENQENDHKIQRKLVSGEYIEELQAEENIERKKLPSETSEDRQNKEQQTLSQQEDESNQTLLKAKTLPEDTPDINKYKKQPPESEEKSETKAIETKKLGEIPSDSNRDKEQLQIPEATTEAESLKAKKLDDITPEVKSRLGESQTEGNVNNLTGKTPTAAPQSQAETQAASGVSPVTETVVSPQSAAPTAAPAAPTTGGGEIATSAPAIESGGGAASGEVAGETEDEAELAEVAAANENVELDSGERDAAMASLAEGGGDGAAPGGGGGGGAAIADKPTPTVPNVSQSDPSAALAAVANLPPAQLQAALGGVSAAVGNTVGKERAELAANPPQMASPSTATVTKNDSAIDKSLPEGKTPKTVEKAPEGETKSVPQPPPLSLAAKPNIAALTTPQVTGNAEGKLDSGDAQKLQASLRNLPTQDSGLQQVSLVSPPPLELAGDADPKQAQQQREKLEKSLAQAQNQGQEDIAQPMGENEIYPQISPETLRAEGISGGGGSEGNVAPGVGAGVVGDEAVSIIAQQQKGAEIQAAVAQAQSQIATQRQSHSTQVAAEKAKSNQEIANLQTENAAQQAQEKAKAQGEVTKLRGDWQKQQDELVTKSRSEANEVVNKGSQDVIKEQNQAEKQAAEHIEKGEKDADIARKEGEAAAEKERQKGEQESGGILGWLADKAKAFCEGIKQGIQKAFEVARAVVKAAIEGAQKLATAAIELGRKAIVGIIKTVGNALIAIGDKLLAAFPGLRDRFRNAIKTAVKVAETAVNTLAKTLKKGVQTALNLLGKGLNAALGLLEKGMMAAVDIANGAVQGAIKFADAAIKALGAFAVL
ncbi:hypothetical protein [Limnofasciculus baicalensis]|uniref:Uncharacterized protein n=1 Tax=Limnofasciculus baicalensis BBK-W-15 TaxID=2699891 RepID=A0AAE3KP87_9CYAN|nr:hypothetical protein [Limnofasciculus baicalensis]MCP2731310.1 hypothetical protein [Limnofasciculus baicalensis BBK-W-15]